MGFLSGIWDGLEEAFFMFWATLWALVLGFTLSGAVQAFVSRAEMRRSLGDHRPVTLGEVVVVRGHLLVLFLRGIGVGEELVLPRRGFHRRRWCS